MVADGYCLHQEIVLGMVKQATNHDNYFDTSHIVEYTSGTPCDIYSKLRTNLSFSNYGQWTAATDMTATDATRPVIIWVHKVI